MSAIYALAYSCSSLYFFIRLARDQVSKKVVVECRLLIAHSVAFAYSSEVFPLFNREVGMSWAVFVNLFFAGKRLRDQLSNRIMRSET